MDGCFRYLSDMSGVFPIGISWVEVEASARLHKIKLTPSLLMKIREAEKLTIEESARRRKKDARK